MPKLHLRNGAVVEGSIDEIAELAKTLDCGEVAKGYRKISGRDPRVGDFVKFIGNDVDITVGKYYEIVGIDDDGYYRFYDDVDEKNFVSPGADNVEFYEKVNADADEAEPELKVGDYVVPLPSADERYGITNSSMKLGKILKVENNTIKIVIVSHENSGLVGNDFDVKKEYFRKASPREVVFGKAGRNLGEFKVGDVVRVVNGSSSGLKGYDGIITEIDQVRGRSLYHVVKPDFIDSHGDTLFSSSDLELVVTVENRVDR